MTRMTTITFAAAALFAMAATAPASAAPLRASQQISYADLDLDNEAGSRTMLARIRNAAFELCGGRWGAVSLREHARTRACTEAKVERAVYTIANPTLTQLYLRRPVRVTIERS